MPFDSRPLVALDPVDRRARRRVAAWLFALCGMILVMIGLGGATRLTGSGLSIMEWAPLSGALPPLSGADWHHLFALYRQIPQYHLLHEGMGLSGFKQIFWLEWTHRLWGRLVGVVFLAPLLWLWATGAIRRRLYPRLLLLFALGGLQGAVGWFMVASGFFPDSTAVSPYRLVIHLALALVLYVALLWMGLAELRPTPEPYASPILRRMAWVSASLVGLTIVAGGFTAGLHAGLAYNTFPLMDGHLVPEGYGLLHPWLRNLTENVPAVQFDHRLLATLTAVSVAATVAVGLREAHTRASRIALRLLAFAVAVQYCLGVATLLAVVPLALANAHQVTAVLLLTAAVFTLHTLRAGHPAPYSQPPLTQPSMEPS